MSRICVTNQNCLKVEKKIQNAKELHDDLYVSSAAELNLPSLTSCASLRAAGSAKIHAPALRVAGTISAQYSGTVIAPVLREAMKIEVITSSLVLPTLANVTDSVEITDNRTIYWPALTYVRNLIMKCRAEVILPALVAAETIITEEVSSLELPALIEVGCLSIKKNSSLYFPSLRTVKGDLFIDTALDPDAERKLWRMAKNNRWVITDRCSEWLQSRTGDITLKARTRKMMDSIYRLSKGFSDSNITDKEYIEAIMTVMDRQNADKLSFVLQKIQFGRPFDFLKSNEMLSGTELCSIILFFYNYVKSKGVVDWKTLPFFNLLSEDDFLISVLGLLLSGNKEEKELYQETLVARRKLEEVAMKYQNGFI
jgi:hypothetical protein